MKKVPKEVWVIFDPLDGPHLFISERQALRAYQKWEQDAIFVGSHDSFWDMSEPTKYVLEKKKK